MKKSFLLLAALFMCGLVMSAEETTVTLDFSDPTQYGLAVPAVSAGTNLEDSTPYTSNGITITAVKGSASTATRFYNSNGTITLRAYNKSTLTFAANNAKIKSITFTGTVAATADEGTLSGKAWTGDAESVVFSMTATNTYNSATIVYEKIAPPPPSGPTTTLDLTKPTDFGVAAPASGSGTNIECDKEYSNGIASFSVSEGGTTPPRFWNTNDKIDFRAYKNATFTVRANGKTIKAINFEGTFPATCSIGEWVATTCTWNGSSTSVSFDITGTTKITAITVTYEDGPDPVFVPMPTISPEGGDFISGITAPVTVKMACADAAATIYYSMDGGSAYRYTGPFSISESCTLTAWAVKGTDKSDEITVDFEINDPNYVSTVEEFYNFDDEAKGELAMFRNSLKVEYQNGNSLIVSDNTGSMLVYGNVGKTYQRGDIIPAGIGGSISIYGGVVQLSPTAGTFKDPISRIGMPDPEIVNVLTINDVEPYLYHYVHLRNVTLTPADRNKMYTMTDGTMIEYEDPDTGEKYEVEAAFVAYNQYNLTLPEISEDYVYSLEGFTSSYNELYELFITAIRQYPTGVDKVSDKNAEEVNAYGVPGAILVTSPKTCTATVYNISGQTIAKTAINEGVNTIALPKGLYVIKVDNLAARVIVR